MAAEAIDLVTGGCGFIGSHLVEALVARGGAVRVLDNLSSGRRANLDAVRDRVEIVEGDVRDADGVREAMRGVRHVYHEAALVSVPASIERPAENHAINLTGTLNVLEAARAAGAARVVFASSASVYGDAPELPARETAPPAPTSPYALAKATGEAYLRLYAGTYGLATVSLRYFNVYGPRQDPGSMYSGVVARFCEAARRGERPTVFGDGRQTRDFVFVGDVVEANLRAARAPGLGRGEVFNVGTGRRVSLLDLLETLGEIAGRPLAPAWEAARRGDARDSVADPARATERLGFTARTTLREGLTRMARGSSGTGGLRVT
jgi:UDP-glucose 4-epimerase